MALTQVDQGLLGTYAQYTGFKNRIINGAMAIDQRNAGAAVTPSTPTYLVDRWYVPVSDASKLTFQQVADAPSGFKYSMKITVAASATPTSYNFLWQPIEGFNVIDLGFGTSGAQNIAVSFWIKGSVAGNYSVFVGNNAGRSYLASIPVTTSWAYQTVSISGDTSGTWGTTNGAGIYLGFDLGSDATRYSTAGTWLSSNVYGVTGNVKFISQANNSTLNITGVQLEKGSTATSFDYRPYGTELQLCQRYFQTFGGVDSNTVFGTGIIQGATNSEFNIVLPVQMRAAPTASISGTASNFLVASNTTATATAIGFDIYTINNFRCSPTIGSGLITTGYGAFLRANGSTAAKINATAEL